MDILDQATIRRVATYIFVETTSGTTTGNWHTHINEISSEMGVLAIDIQNNAQSIVDALYECFELQVLDAEYNSDTQEFNVTIGADFCVNDCSDD